MAMPIFSSAQDEFIKHANLTQDEEDHFKMTSLEDLKNEISKLQKDQEAKRRMVYMRRLEPFLKSMDAYGKVVEVFLNTSNILAFVWGPMKFILLTACSHMDALHSVLDAYQSIGEQIPLLADFELFASNIHMKEILGLIYVDILEFHKEAIKHFKKPFWKQVFSATWRGFETKITHLTANMRKHRELIETRANIMQYQEICALRKAADDDFVKRSKDLEDARRERVKRWLIGFNHAAELDRLREIRAVCPGSGRWLLENSQFQGWFSLTYCSSPLLWLTGIPGAGKTILASIIIDEISSLSRDTDITIAYAFCRYGDNLRNNFVSIARSFLIQLLPQTIDLLSHLDETAASCSDCVLSSKKLAEELLEIVLTFCTKKRTVYAIIDGVDECGREDRKSIADWFQNFSDGLLFDERTRFRCLFVSQDDGISRKDFGKLPRIKISKSDNKRDIEAFSAFWHRKIEAKFGRLQSADRHIANLVTARSQGMFLFAKLMLLHLEDQASLQDLLIELDPSRFPIKLDDAYGRIMHRMTDSRAEKVRKTIQRVLGWVACAPRPLRWREIQGAICIDLEDEATNSSKQLLETPKGLFTAFIEIQSNGMVDMVHGTAREYLIRSKYVEPIKVHSSLALLSMAYLSMPQLDKNLCKTRLREELFAGFYAFLDYASACWIIHLQNCIAKSHETEEHNFPEIGETLEIFIGMHISDHSHDIPTSKTAKDIVARLPIDDDCGNIAQALSWAQKQLIADFKGSPKDPVLSLGDVVAWVREALEEGHSSQSPAAGNALRNHYGFKWFKCERLSCYYYHEGFLTAKERNNHYLKHTRPFLCVIPDCHHGTFGHTTEHELHKHLFEYHGIDMLDKTEYPEWRKPTNQTTSQSTRSGSTCPICSKAFTRPHNLKNHLRSHKGEKKFKCGQCSKSFLRPSDRKRHESQHDGERYSCFGQLDDGTEWGCKAEFSRADKRQEHFRKAGQKCIMPFAKQEYQKKKTAGSIQDGAIPDDIFNESNAMLPNFQDFLHICGLDTKDNNSL